MLKIFVVDYDKFPVNRTKRLKFKTYFVGRGPLLELAPQSTQLILTTNQLSKINKIHPNEILYCDNTMWDFSGYLVAISQALQKGYTDIIVMNSSTPKGVAQQLIESRHDYHGVLGVGGKSFARKGLCLKFSKHIQSFCFRIKGVEVIGAFFNFLMELSVKLEDGVDTKHTLINEGEIGLSKFLREQNIKVKLLRSDNSQIDINSFKFPIIDSRLFDARYQCF